MANPHIGQKIRISNTLRKQDHRYVDQVGTISQVEPLQVMMPDGKVLDGYGLYWVPIDYKSPVPS